MSEAVHKTGNGVLIDTYAQKTALRLGVAAESVRSEFKKSSTPAITYTVAEETTVDADESFETAMPEMPPPTPLELHLLKLLFLHDELAAYAVAHLDVDWIQHPQVRHIIDLRLAAQEHETWHSLTEFLDGFESPDERSLITGVVMEARKMPDPEIQLADVALKLRNQSFDRQIAALTRKISQPETSDEEKLAVLHDLQTLRQAKRTPLAARFGH